MRCLQSIAGGVKSLGHDLIRIRSLDVFSLQNCQGGLFYFVARMLHEAEECNHHPCTGIFSASLEEIN